MQEGKYINIYGRDITQAKKDQVQLNSLSLIIQQTQQCVVITDADVKITWVNKAFETTTGYTFDEIKGKKPGNFLQGPETSKDTIKYMRRQIRKSKPFACEVYNYKKTGEGYWLRIICQPVFDAHGKLIQFFALEEDITEEKKTKEKIQEAANRMSSLITNLNAGILLVNENKTIELVNHSFCELFEVPIYPLDLVGRDWSASDDQFKYLFKEPELYIMRVQGILQEKNLVIGDILEMVDGRFISRDFIPIWNDDKYEGYLWVYTDITLKMNSEKKLKEQRIFYEEILDNIPADIAVFDNQHHYLYVNPKGIKDDKLRKWIVGKKDEDYVNFRNKPMSIAKGRRKLFNSILEGKVLRSWEEELKQRDGSSNYLLRHMSPVLDEHGEVKLVIGYAVDISYTKSILLQIEQSEKRYRDVIENSLAIVTTHDMEGKFLTVNPMVYKIFGYTDDEIIGHSLSEFLPEKDKQLFDKDYLNEIKKNKTFSGIFKVIHKDGHIIYTLYNNFLKEEAGKEPYVIGFAMDISDRIKVEKELKTAKQMSEEMAKSKQSFLANMSHEIRTPMNAIMGMTNQLSKTLLNNDQQFYLNIIHSASENLLFIINEILDLSKIESGKFTLEQIGFEPKNVISKVMQVMMHKAEEKGLAFTNTYCDPSLSDVLIGDPYRLNQVLLNLISNAIKFTEKGSVDINCRVISQNNNQQTIKVEVKDTGIGMSEEFTKKVFKKYTQENESVSRIFGGTGLGMSICEELVQLMGGKIFIESKKGVGTAVSFVITFNKGTVEQLPVKETAIIGTAVLKDKKILITDDNEMNRLVASTILNNYHAITVEAKNGLEAIEKIKNEKFDIVLMDVQMPVMGGVEATHEIRKNISTSLPIIALTAFAIKGDNITFMNAGMNDYLSKPFEENQLLQVVCRWLEKSEIINGQQIVQENIEPLYDLNKLLSIANGNHDFVKKMVNLFIEQVPISMDEIQTAYNHNDYERVAAIAHRIKPSIDNMGINSLKNEIRQIELLAATQLHSDELTKHIQHIDVVLKNVVKSIEEHEL
jgi:PAS domain S-box-containing protein